MRYRKYVNTRVLDRTQMNRKFIDLNKNSSYKKFLIIALIRIKFILQPHVKSANETVHFTSGTIRGGIVKVSLKKEDSDHPVMTRLLIHACVQQLSDDIYPTSKTSTGKTFFPFIKDISDIYKHIECLFTINYHFKIYILLLFVLFKHL